MKEKNKLKICFFSGDITRSGGTERVSSIIANQLEKGKKMNICFLSLFEKKKNTFFLLNDEIKRYTLYDNEVSGAKHILGLIFRIHKFVKTNKVDVLIDIDGILDVYSIPALFLTKTKLVSWEQFNYYQNPNVNYRKFTRKWAAKRADAIVVLTDEDKGYYKQNLRIRGKLQRIYNPIESTENSNEYDEDSRIIISAGRLVEQKGFDMLIDVAKRVFADDDGWKWLILGEGEEREKLEIKIRDKGLEEKVILKGNVSNIEAYYKKAAIYVLTSRYEGFGLVLTEAKNMGLPCVSFRCPAGPSEIIIDGVNGYLVECFDVEQMAEKIKNLMKDSELRAEFSKRAMEGTEKFDIENISRQWEHLLLNL